MQLRNYQIGSIEALRDGMRAGHKRQVLCAATGGGKSIIMLAMIRSAVEKGSRVMFICERRILVEQFSAHLDRAGIDHGILMADSWRFRPDMLVQVASAQTLERMESWPAFDICFIDEIHACLRKSVITMLKNRPELRVIGATATPFHPALVENFSNVVNVISMRELVEDGHLVPFRVFVAKEIDVSGLKVVAGEWKKDDLEVRGQAIVGDIVSDYIRLSNDVFGGPRKTICFSCGVAHGTELAQKFNEVGINAVQISYKDSDEFKAEVLADFARPDTEIKIVISSDILTRGFDQPDVEHVILARPLKKSFSSHVQMVGRGARPYPDKQFCLIQDHAGNWIRFSDSWDELFHDGVKVLSAASDKKLRKEPSEKEKKDAKCPKCSAVWIGRTDVCAHCGFVRKSKSQVSALPGVMSELSGTPKKEKYSIEYKTEFYAGLLGYAKNKGFKDGYAYWKYKEKFGVGPSMKTPARTQPTPEVLNWIASRAIAFSKAHGK